MHDMLVRMLQGRWQVDRGQYRVSPEHRAFDEIQQHLKMREVILAGEHRHRPPHRHRHVFRDGIHVLRLRLLDQQRFRIRPFDQFQARQFDRPRVPHRRVHQHALLDVVQLVEPLRLRVDRRLRNRLHTAGPLVVPAPNQDFPPGRVDLQRVRQIEPVQTVQSFQHPVKSRMGAAMHGAEHHHAFFDPGHLRADGRRSWAARWRIIHRRPDDAAGRVDHEPEKLKQHA